MYSERPKKYINILVGIAVIFMILAIRLFEIQIVNRKYQVSALNNTLRYETKYPSRGLIKDREGRILVTNRSTFDITVTPYDAKNFDTTALCDIFSLDREFVREKFRYYRTYRSRIGFQSLVFLKQVSLQEYNRFIEEAEKFPGFKGISRTIRDYPYNAGANILGYVTEVDQYTIEKDDFYQPGDFVGRTGIEQTCENELRGEKGYNIYLRNASNVIQAPYQDGAFDKAAKLGNDIYSTIDAELQKYSESLMKNKVGSVVAIEPSTGEILAMVSSPGIDVEQLANINKYYSSLVSDPYKPLFNRAVMSPQPPGSVFKLANALIGLQEGIVRTGTSFPCHEGYYAGNLKVGCHSHKSPVNLRESIMVSCNAYYCALFREIIDSPIFNDPAASMDMWNKYVKSLGLCVSTGSDFPNEKSGYLPDGKYYNRIYGKGRWKALSAISLSIGQGEISTTTLQLANFASTIANRGYYISPHIIKYGEDSPDYGRFTEKHYSLIDSVYFIPVIEGMEMAVNSSREDGATASAARIPGVTVCGKTGTAENPHGDTHSVFLCFAPKDNPKIAIATYIENAGFGATWAAPVASLIVEKYLNDTISSHRKYLEERILESNLLDKVPAAGKKQRRTDRK